MTGASQRLPYPGLRAFNRDEADLFFGRDTAVNELILRLSQTRFLAVLGASGTGKSSLVRTGMLDGLELGLHPAGANWRFCDIAPGGHPIRSLARGLLRLSADDGGERALVEEDVEALEWFLRRGPRSLIEWLDEGHLPQDVQLLVLVDQFEELFRFADYEDREVAEAFVKLLIHASRETDGRIHVVITMRSEFLGACVLIPDLAETINAGSYLTPRMDRDGCEMAIVGPARMFGTDVDPALVNRLLNDLDRFAPFEDDGSDDQARALSRRADQLPVMQHVLNRVWQAEIAEGNGKELRLETYQHLGGIGGALNQHGEEILARLGDDRTAVCEKIFRALVTGNTIATARRRALSFADLVRETDLDAAVVQEIVEAFRSSDVNFLRPPADVPLSDRTVIDISHESLIRQWSKLSDWLSNEARGAAVIRRVTDSKDRYDSGEGDLLSGLDLANISSWWAEDNPTADWARRYTSDFDGIESYLKKSLETEKKQLAQSEAKERRERTRLRVFAGATSAVAIAAAFFFWDARQQRDEAVDLRAAAESSQAEMLMTTESLAIDLVERLENDPTIPVHAKYDLIRDTENALTALAASRSSEPDFINQQANFLLASVHALSRGGFWREAADYARRLEVFLSERPKGWEPDLRFEIRSAVALSEHHRMAARKEDGERWLRTAQEKLALADTEAASFLTDSARFYVADARLAQVWFLFERQWRTSERAWDHFETELAKYQSEATQLLEAQQPDRYTERQSALADLAVAVVQTQRIASSTILQIDADDRFGIDYPQILERAKVALDYLGTVDGVPEPVLFEAQLNNHRTRGLAENDNDAAGPAAVAAVDRAVELAEDLSALDPTNRHYRNLLFQTLIVRSEYATEAGQFGQAEVDIEAAYNLLLDLRLNGMSWVDRASWEPWLHYLAWNLAASRGSEPSSEQWERHALTTSLASLRAHTDYDPRIVARVPGLLAFIDLSMLSRDLVEFADIKDSVDQAMDAMPVEGYDPSEPYFWLAQRQYVHGQLVSLGPETLGQEAWEDAFSDGVAEADLLLEIAPGAYRPLSYKMSYEWDRAQSAHNADDAGAAIQLYRRAYDAAVSAASSERVRDGEFNYLIDSAVRLMRNIVSLSEQQLARDDVDRLERFVRSFLSAETNAVAMSRSKEQLDALANELLNLSQTMAGSDDALGQLDSHRMEALVETMEMSIELSLAADLDQQRLIESNDAVSADFSTIRSQLRELLIDEDLLDRGLVYWVRPPLMSGIWQTLEGERFDAMVATLSGTGFGLSDISYIRSFELPFYEDGQLVEVQVGVGERAQIFAYLVLRDYSVFRLNGTSPPIHEANAQAPVILETPDQVAAYVRFFTHYVNGEEGSFSIVENTSEIPFSSTADLEEFERAQKVMRPFVIWPSPSEPDVWMASGTVYYGQSLFHSIFRVVPTGMMEMMGDTPLATNLEASLIRVSDREAGVRLKGESAGRSINYDRIRLKHHETAPDLMMTAIRQSTTLPSDEAAALRQDFLAPMLHESFVDLHFEHASHRNTAAYELLLSDLDIELALRLSELASSSLPGDPYILDTYGWALLKAGQHGRAIEALERAYADVSDEAEIAAHLAQAYRIVGRFEDAENLIEKALTMSPNPFWLEFLVNEKALLD